LLSNIFLQGLANFLGKQKGTLAKQLLSVELSLHLQIREPVSCGGYTVYNKSQILISDINVTILYKVISIRLST